MTVQPAARAGAILRTASTSGKFQGLIAPTTPIGRFDDEVAFAIDLVRNDAAISATRFLGKPAQMIDGHGDFALTLRERLAVFERDQCGRFHRGGVPVHRQFFRAIRHGLFPFGAASQGKLFAHPRWPGDRGRSTRLMLSEGFAGGWIDDWERLLRDGEFAIQKNGIGSHFGTLAQSFKKRSTPRSVKGCW